MTEGGLTNEDDSSGTPLSLVCTDQPGEEHLRGLERMRRLPDMVRSLEAEAGRF
jgi:hypothetical protein